MSEGARLEGTQSSPHRGDLDQHSHWGHRLRRFVLQGEASQDLPPMIPIQAPVPDDSIQFTDKETEAWEDLRSCPDHMGHKEASRSEGGT